MISLAEPTAGFSTLSRQFKRLTQELMDNLSLEPETVQFGAARKTIGTHMDPGKTYLVKSGMLNVICQGKKLFTWDEGDLILPDTAPEAPDSVDYSCDAPVLLAGFDTLALVRAALASDKSAKLWTRLMMTQQAVVLRLLAAQTEEQATTTPGFAYYQPGDIIIQQGDPADYVFSLFEGSAEVLVDDVSVAEVNEGEVLGALAVLTQSARSATVKAKTRCSVVKVPKDQFKTLIRSNPTMIHALLTDMAKQIKHLNTQVVELSGWAAKR